MNYLKRIGRLVAICICAVCVGIIPITAHAMEVSDKQIQPRMDYISSYGTELTISDSGEASYAEKSVGLTDGTDAGREAVKWYGVRNGLHLQKTNKNLRWDSVH